MELRRFPQPLFGMQEAARAGQGVVEEAFGEHAGLTCRKPHQEVECLGLRVIHPASYLTEWSYGGGHMPSRPVLQNSLQFRVMEKNLSSPTSWHCDLERLPHLSFLGC